MCVFQFERHFIYFQQLYVLGSSIHLTGEESEARWSSDLPKGTLHESHRTQTNREIQQLNPVIIAGHHSTH